MRVLAPLPVVILSTLCFHGLTNWFSRKSVVVINICVAGGCGVLPKLSMNSVLSVPSVVKRLVSDTCGLFCALSALFEPLALCFQSFTDSFCKTPGWGYVALATPKSQGHDSFSCVAPGPRNSVLNSCFQHRRKRCHEISFTDFFAVSCAGCGCPGLGQGQA